MGTFAALVKQCQETASFVPFVQPGQVFLFYPIHPADIIEYVEVTTDLPLDGLSKARVVILDIAAGTFTLHA